MPAKAWWNLDRHAGVQAFGERLFEHLLDPRATCPGPLAIPRCGWHLYPAAMHEADDNPDRGPEDPSQGPGMRGGVADRRRRARRLFVGAITILGLWVARDYLVALAWAVLIAIAAWPLNRRWATAIPGRRTLTSALSTLLASLVLLLPLVLVAVAVGSEAQTALQWLAEAQQHGVPAPDWLAGIPLLGGYA